MLLVFVSHLVSLVLVDLFIFCSFLTRRNESGMLFLKRNSSQAILILTGSQSDDDEGEKNIVFMTYSVVIQFCRRYMIDKRWKATY